MSNSPPAADGVPPSRGQRSHDRAYADRPRAIQPHGLLLALEPATLTIVQASANCKALLGRSAGALIGRPLGAALGDDLAALVETIADGHQAGLVRQGTGHWKPPSAGSSFWCTLSLGCDPWLLELEAEDTHPDADAELPWQALEGMARVRAERRTPAKLDAAVELVRALTGYDRVLIYRFAPTRRGVVVAEACSDELEPCLGLSCPACEVQGRARRRLPLSPVHAIVDTQASVVPLVSAPGQQPGTGSSLDATATPAPSLGVLHAAAPKQLGHLRRMGIRATLTVALVCNDQVWGLLACHHRAPRRMPGRLRTLLASLTQDLATQVGLAQALESERLQARLRAHREQVLAAVRGGEHLEDLLRGPYLARLLGCVGADGVAVLDGVKVHTGGATPPPERIADLAKRLEALSWPTGQPVFHTDCISSQLPGTEDLAATAAALLYLPLGAVSDRRLIWFRRGQGCAGDRAGDPQRAAQRETHPHEPFGAGRKMARLQGRPWDVAALDSARQLAVLVDIELKRAAEQAMQEALAKYQAVFEHFPLGITVCGPDGTIIEANRVSQALLGLSREAQLERQIDGREWTVRHPDGRPMATDEYASVRALRHGELVRDQEMVVLSPQGERQWLSVTAAPLAPERLGAVIVFEDISARKEMQAKREAHAALSRSERRFRIMADELPLMIWVANAEKQVTMVNKTCCEFFGEPEHRLLAEGWRRWLHPEDAAAYLTRFDDCVSAQAPCQGRCRVRRADGAWRWIESFARPLCEPDGRFGGYVGTSVDITERKRAEDALQDSHRTLERHAEQLGRLTSALTLAEQRERERLAKVLHDHLQQLLVGASFGIERASRRLRERVDEADAQALSSVHDLLEQAIAAARTLVADLTPPILHEGGLVPALEWVSRNMAEHHGLEVALALDQTVLPQRDDVRSVLFESAREALFNVVKHAGVRRAEVRLESGSPGWLRLLVSDQGAGFDSAALERHERDGTGFGILAMRERLRWLGGRCRIDSMPGQGTRVLLEAPVGATTAAAADRAAVGADGRSAAAAQGQGGGGERQQGSCPLLLVDDHQMVREGLRALLQDEPAVSVVGEARDGAEALELIPRVKPALVLMDYSMPRMDGLTATREIRQRWPEIRVIGLSMYQEADRAAAMLDAGAVAYVDKTAGSDALLAAVRRELADGAPNSG